MDQATANPDRPERVYEGAAREAPTVVQRPLSIWERIAGTAWVRKLFILLALALIWDLYARVVDNSLLFPTFVATARAFVLGVVEGPLIERSWMSIRLLLFGYSLGVVLAAFFTALAMGSRLMTDFLQTLTAMFSPLPAIAMLPLALIWFGIGSGSVIFVVVQSVLWAIALNTLAGFLGVSQTLQMVGRNYGLRGLPFVRRILIPAAFPSILTGLKVGWAFAWRTLIAAELVFGVSSGSGGLGWYIFENKNLLEIENVFAGLFSVILIGLLVENAIFLNLERRTVRRWGMQA